MKPTEKVRREIINRLRKCSNEELVFKKETSEWYITKINEEQARRK